MLIVHIPLYGAGPLACLDAERLWSPLLDSAPIDCCISGHTHRAIIHEKGAVGNPYPIVIGGGTTPESGTVMMLEAGENGLHVHVRGEGTHLDWRC